MAAARRGDHGECEGDSGGPGATGSYFILEANGVNSPHLVIPVVYGRFPPTAGDEPLQAAGGNRLYLLLRRYNLRPLILV